MEISGDLGQVVEFPVLVFPELESKKRFINLNGKLFDVETNFYGNGLHVFRQCTKPGWTSQEMVVYFFLNKKKRRKEDSFIVAQAPSKLDEFLFCSS